ncbi:MAG: hypothetical protein IJR93_10380 [Treponema sp.]|nr:hypothetical protein [Treponema sp.]MBQ7167338.1 hypothetical protein [Treponema sp.]
MTRHEYLDELKWELRSLSVEEQEDALEYYLGYFEDAGNDEAVMKEFGSPTELASSILSKFAGLPAERREKQKNTSGDGSSGAFTRDEVKSLDVSVGVAEVVIIANEQNPDAFSLDYRGLGPGDISFGLSPFGTLSVENSRRVSMLNFIGHRDTDDGHVNHPRILIRVPKDAAFDSLKLHMGAGSLKCKGLGLSSKRSYIEVGAGLMEIENLSSTNSKIRCGMGSLNITGRLDGITTLDCGMGSVKLDIMEGEEGHSVFAKIGLGSFEYDNIKKGGITTFESGEKKKNHFSINCGMGEVKIRSLDRNRA